MDAKTDSLKVAYDILGGLVEAALRDQKLTGDAIQAMKVLVTSIDEQRTTLPTELSSAVKDQLATSIDSASATFVNNVRNANLAAAEAEKAFERASKFAIWSLCLPALGATAVAIAVWLGIAYFSVARLEANKESLQATVASLQETVGILEARGGRFDLATCPTRSGTGICVRVDLRRDYGGGYRLALQKR